LEKRLMSPVRAKIIQGITAAKLSVRVARLGRDAK
jgi:hypothetical protein